MGDTIDGQLKRGHRVPRIRPLDREAIGAEVTWPPEIERAFVRRVATDPVFRRRVHDANAERSELAVRILEELIVDRDGRLARGEYKDLVAIGRRRALAKVPRPHPMED